MYPKTVQIQPIWLDSDVEIYHETIKIDILDLCYESGWGLPESEFVSDLWNPDPDPTHNKN